MKTRRIVGVALILFCVILLFVYTFGFIISPSKTTSTTIVAKKEDISNQSAVIDVSVTNKTSGSVQNNTPVGNQVIAAPSQPASAQQTPTVRTTNRVTSAS